MNAGRKFLRRRNLGSIAVLMFHGICQRVPEFALFPMGRTCLLHCEDFSELIRWCCMHFDIIASADLDDIVTNRRRVRRPLLLTFDDALASVVDLALPILKERRCSATVFITSEWTDRGCVPPIFQLEKIVYTRLPVTLSITIGDREWRQHFCSRAGIGAGFQRLWDFLFLHRFPPLKLRYEQVRLDGACVQENSFFEDRTFWFPASWDELRSALQQGAIDIGSHMCSHTPLTWLKSDDVRKEMVESRARLEREFARPVRCYSLPHGLYDDQVCRLAAETYDWGFSSRRGVFRSPMNHHCVPRIHVPAEGWKTIKIPLLFSRWHMEGIGVRLEPIVQRLQ